MNTKPNKTKLFDAAIGAETWTFAVNARISDDRARKQAILRVVNRCRKHRTTGPVEIRDQTTGEVITGTVTIKTMNNEILVDNGAMEMGLRQGSYRTNPFVLRYSIDTMAFLIGTYKYRITATLPDGTSRTSGDFILTIS